MLTKDRAICIRVVDYSETSQVATFFTRTAGKINAIAKGSKRPRSAFDGPIEMLCCGQIVFSGSPAAKLAVLTEFQADPDSPGPALSRTNLFALNAAFFAAELLNRLTCERDPHPCLFDAFIEFLNNVRAAGRAEVLALLILFQLALLKEIGLHPVLTACANCKRPYTHPPEKPAWDEVYFSSSANGLLCRDCEPAFQDKFKLTADAAGRLARPKLLAEALPPTLLEIEKLLVFHFTELIGRSPKMAKYILKG